VAHAFEKKFGCLPVEAYGATECSPGIAVNAQASNQPGSIGRLLKNLEAKVVSPDSGEERSPGESGLLKVKGPNVMMGYLGMPDQTAEVLRDGWYDTGDIVRIDEEGYLWIEGRLSRFSKIGGEMVPHGNVEEALNDLADQNEQIFAVTGLPDEKKGERLVVVHTASDELLEEVLKKLAGADLPNLWKPKPGQFLKVEKLPYLGTGKLDLKGLQKLAEG
jgi:acyl-[acyl-carrier-protein]-phospholipid O-acyltransferase/long-chain-fatty-acid--[acyl-carrier-protein] ligase